MFPGDGIHFRVTYFRGFLGRADGTALFAPARGHFAGRAAESWAEVIALPVAMHPLDVSQS